MPSVFSTTFSFAIGRVKLGQPVPLSNLSSELKSGSPSNHVDVDPRAMIAVVFILEWRLGAVLARYVVLQRRQAFAQFGIVACGSFRLPPGAASLDFFSCARLRKTNPPTSRMVMRSASTELERSARFPGTKDWFMT